MHYELNKKNNGVNLNIDGIYLIWLTEKKNSFVNF